MSSLRLSNDALGRMKSSEPTPAPGRADPLSRRAAVLYADMVEFSRRMERDEAQSAGQVARSLQLFRALVGDYGGQVANIAGDGIVALFDDPGAALRFAIQIQTQFREQSVWGDGHPIEFRIGLNVGDVTFHDAIAYGHCINVAARLQSLAEPGGIVVTGAFRSAAPVPAGILLRSLGRPHLKNISESIEIFAVDPIGGAAPIAFRSREGPKSEQVGHPGIAVLALANLSDDPRNNHLCEGIAEDIIANLTRFRNLMVIARHSAFLFNLRENSAEEVRGRLGAGYILGGSLRRADNRLRIAVELIDAASGSALLVRSVQCGDGGDFRSAKRDRRFGRSASLDTDRLRRASSEIPISARHARLRACSPRSTFDPEIHQGGELACAAVVRGGRELCAGVQPRLQRALSHP
jgi:adenylate cyclase